MNIFYWNINKGLSDEKKVWLDRAIALSPDIFCLAEGPENPDDCEELIELVCNKGYRSYYDPTKDHKYGWDKLGLKVFVKTGVKLKSYFTFYNQQLQGRIIYLRFEKDGVFYGVFLVHGSSKIGNQLHQGNFIIELSSFIKTKALNNEDKIIILGDFNVEPWDTLLANTRYIYSLFHEKALRYFFDRKLSKIYFSPIFEYLQRHADPKLIGTFYNKDYVSILDYALLSKELTNYEIGVITEFNNEHLMEFKRTKYLLVDGFDHLPITLKIV